MNTMQTTKLPINWIPTFERSSFYTPPLRQTVCPADFAVRSVDVTQRLEVVK